MKSFVGVTDGDWFDLLSSIEGIDEVNFWQPSGRTNFRALQPGELFLFKLHSPRNFIVGGGFFAHFSQLPVSLAWESFGEKNGATSLEEMRARIEKYRRGRETDRFSDYDIGCILLEQPFFLPEELWVPAPGDWSPNIVRGKGYDLSSEPGRTMWLQIQQRLQTQRPAKTAALGLFEGESQQRFGKPLVTVPRLGQGSFRVLVTDAYERRCTVTGERVLPVLEAAHIKPFSLEGPNRVDNGLLLRRDLHTLFDRGYVTVTPGRELEVSRRIKEDWENGREYYQLHGRSIRVPTRPEWEPAGAFLEWHNENVYRG